MPHFVGRRLRLIINWLKKFLKSNRACRTLLYDIRNAEEFSDLYEHEKMLADTVRISCYREAIKRHILPGSVVVDLGTGTGVLSFFAAQQRPERIYAIDHSDFINVSRKIAEHNNISAIRFIQTNSRTFDPGEKVDVILHEQLGDNLFNENMLENILDLKDRLLKRGGIILPGKFELFLEPISLKDEHKVPFLWDIKLENSNVDFGFLKNSGAIEQYKPVDYKLKWLDPAALDYFLCEPQPIFSFDINELKDTGGIPASISTSKKVLRSGAMDGICLYFRVIFDDEIHFDTSPAHTRTHWGNRLFRLDSTQYEPGENISYVLTMKDILNIEEWTLTVSPRK